MTTSLEKDRDNIKALIDAISNTSSEDISTIFESLLAARIEDKVQARRQSIAESIALSELSTSTVGSYYNKTLDKMVDKSDERQAAKKAGNKDGVKSIDKKTKLMGKGLTMAGARLKGTGHSVLDELSTDLLSRYKKKAGEQASAADKVMNFKKADKRFSGIVKATKKQFANDVKESKLTLEDFTAEEIEAFMVSEEFGQLDELSKKTLASYVVAANKSAVAHSVYANQTGRLSNVTAAKAADSARLGHTKDADANRKHSKMYSDLHTDAKKRADKRMAGIPKAAAKLAEELQLSMSEFTQDEIDALVESEEFEQLDELSKVAIKSMASPSKG